MISLRTLLLFYRRHLRVQPVRELMAVAGVAIGVALLFAVEVNARSITASFESVARGVAGRATLEVAARGAGGFEEGVEAQVDHLPGVQRSAPILQQQILASAGKGSAPLTLVGTTEELGSLGGPLTKAWQRAAEGPHKGLLLLTEGTAHEIGARVGSDVAIEIGGRTERLTVDALVASGAIGGLAHAGIAAAPLAVVQTLAGMQHRLTRILIEPASGQQGRVRDELQRRFGATLNVRPVSTEARLLSAAAAPEAELGALFSAIGILVGVVLAYNALLLASTERRRFIGYLIQLGTSEPAIVMSLLFDALLLGIAGSLVGLLLGDAVSALAYSSVPGYIAAAFPAGGQRVIDPQTIATAVGAGILAALIAAVLPAVGILRGSAVAQPGASGPLLSIASRHRWRRSTSLAAGGLLMAASAGVALAWAPSTPVALIALIAGLMLCVPALMDAMTRFGRALARRSSDPSARLAVAELRESAPRSIAMLATGAVAVLMVLTIGGSVSDAQRAVHRGAAETLAGAQLWIKAPGPDDVYATEPFAYTETAARLRRVPAVQSVFVERNSFLDLPARRVWVIGVPDGYPTPIAASQLVSGDMATAERRLAEGGWVLLSQTIASARHLRVGDPFTLPTPSGAARFRLAATISNYGWLPGTVLMNGNDYGRLWGSSLATQLDVALRPGAPLLEAKRAVEAALAPRSALRVQTTAERRAEVSSVLGSTLARLNDTTTIVLIVAITAVVAMMVGAAWQRRGRLDALLSMGMSTVQLARLIFYESGLMVLVGCLLGLCAGLFAQYLVDRWLAGSTGSPVHYLPAWQLGLRTILIATGISALASVVAVVRTIGFQPRAAFSAE